MDCGLCFCRVALLSLLQLWLKPYIVQNLCQIDVLTFERDVTTACHARNEVGYLDTNVLQKAHLVGRKARLKIVQMYFLDLCYLEHLMIH